MNFTYFQNVLQSVKWRKAPTYPYLPPSFPFPFTKIAREYSVEELQSVDVKYVFRTNACSVQSGGRMKRKKWLFSQRIKQKQLHYRIEQKGRKKSDWIHKENMIMESDCSKASEERVEFLFDVRIEWLNWISPWWIDEIQSILKWKGHFLFFCIIFSNCFLLYGIVCSTVWLVTWRFFLLQILWIATNFAPTTPDQQFSQDNRTVGLNYSGLWT